MEKYNVELLPAAYADLDEIFDYILVDNPQAAERTLDKIMDSLRHHPHLLKDTLNRTNVISQFIKIRLKKPVLNDTIFFKFTLCEFLCNSSGHLSCVL